MKTTPLPFDQEGHSNHLENGTHHSMETLIVELFDNSDKAIKDKKEIDGDYVGHKIEYINTKHSIIFVDTGIGIEKNNLDTAFTYYKKTESNGINRSGIGLKHALNNLLKEGWFTLIISKTNDDGGDDYCIKCLVKRGALMSVDDFSDLSSKDGVRKSICNLIPNTGTIIIVNKGGLETGGVDGSKGALKIFNNCINETKDYLDLESIPENDVDVAAWRDGFVVLHHEVIRDMVSDLCDYPYNVMINKVTVTHNKYIKDTDEKMFSLNLYVCEKHNHPQFYLQKDDGNFIPIKYKFTGKSGEVVPSEIDHCKSEYIIPLDDLIKLCRIDYYMPNDEKTTFDSNIAYILKGIRTLCFCPLSSVKKTKLTESFTYIKKVHNYLKVVCTFIDVKWCKKYILKSQKTSDNYKEQLPEGQHKSLNSLMTMVLFNEIILKENGYMLIPYNKDKMEHNKTGNLRHFRISEIKKRFPEILKTQSPAPAPTPPAPAPAPPAPAPAPPAPAPAPAPPAPAPAPAPPAPIKHIKKQKKKGVSLGPGGSLYLYTLKDSSDWGYGTNDQIYRWGKSEIDDQCYTRLRQHATEHPCNEIEICGLWKVKNSCRTYELDVSKKLTDEGYQVDAKGTSTSDFFKGDIRQIKGIIDNQLPAGSSENIFPKIY